MGVKCQTEIAHTHCVFILSSLNREASFVAYNTRNRYNAYSARRKEVADATTAYACSTESGGSWSGFYFAEPA
mgnify:CR=1 FL=1